MSLVIAVPEAMAVAATDLSGIGSTLRDAHAVAEGSTVAIPASAADEVSTAIAGLLSSHGQQFHALSSQAGQFHNQFVQNLARSAESYGSAEAANVGVLAPAAAALSSDVSALLDQVSGSFLYAYAWVFSSLIYWTVAALLLSMFTLLYLAYRVGILSGPPGWF
ncbi:MAG: PE family protein [Mycobacteriaceae bacterium]|nr:PE family protein [Mycobacteriaceae bacterium]